MSLLDESILKTDPLDREESGTPGLFKSAQDAFEDIMRPMGIKTPDQVASQAGGGWREQLKAMETSAPRQAAAAPAQSSGGAGWRDQLRSLEKPKAEEQGDFSRGFSVSGKQLKQTAYGTAALIGDTLGSGSLREWGLKGYQDAEKEVQAISKQSDSFTNAVESGELGKWFKYSTGYLLGQVAELGVASLAGAAVGSAAAPGAGTAAGAVAGAVEKGAVQAGVRSFVGKMIDKQAAEAAELLVKRGVARDIAEKTAVEQATKSVYRTIGATTANTFLNATQELGSIYGDAVEEAALKGEEYSLGKVWLAGLAATAVDSWADSKALGKFMGALGGDKKIRGVAMEALKGGFREGMTEGVQTAIERWGANKDLASKEAFKEYIDSAAVGVLGGGIAGGTSGVINKFTTPSETKPGETRDPQGDGILGESEKAAQGKREQLLPKKLRGITQTELVDTLNNMDAVAFLYSTANPEQQQSLERAIQRADLIAPFQEAKGKKEFIERGAQLFADSPVAIDDLRNAINTFGNTRNLQRRVKLPKRQTVVTEEDAMNRMDEADAALNQGTSTTGAAGTGNTQNFDNDTADQPQTPMQAVQALTGTDDRVFAYGVPLSEWSKDREPNKYGIFSYYYNTKEREQSDLLGASAYSHPALPDMVFPSESAVFDALKIRKQAIADGTWDGPKVRLSRPPAKATDATAPNQQGGQQGTKPAGPAPEGFRQPTAQERDVDGASFTYDVGNGARLMFVPGSGDIFIAPPGQGSSKGVVVRAGDGREGTVGSIDQFPNYVPTVLQKPLLDYHMAVRQASSAEQKNELSRKLIETIDGLQPPSVDKRSPTDTSKLFSKGEDGKVKAVFFKKLKAVFYSKRVLRMTPQQRHALDLHEIGAHYALEQMIGAEEYQKLLSELESLRGKDKRVDEAYASVPTDTIPELVNEEALGYLVENYENMGVVQKFFQMIRDWYAKLTGKRDLTTSDIQKMVVAAFNKHRKEVKRFYLRENISDKQAPGSVRVDFQQALDRSPEAKKFLDFMYQFKDKVRLSGSLAISAQMPIYRPADNQIHDLDFRVMSKDDLEPILQELGKQYPNSAVHIQFASRMTDSDVITMTLNKDDKNALTVDFFTKLSSSEEQQAAPAVDHAYRGADGRQRSITLVSAEDVFGKKIAMRRGKDVNDAIQSDQFGAMLSKGTAPVTLTGTSPYLAKDQAKADQATKFIGQGSERSSTARYAVDFGDRANTGTYTSQDVVFVSAEGNRQGRMEPSFAEIKKAIDAGATILTDDAQNRNRPYNVGERQVAEFLTNNGYSESVPGRWTGKPAEQRQSTLPQNPIRFEDGKAVNATGKLNIPAEEEVKVEPPKTQAKPKSENAPYLGKEDLTPLGKRKEDILERAKNIDDDKVAQKVKGLVKVGRLDQAEQAIEEHFKKKSQPDKAEFNRAKRFLEFLRKAKSAMKVAETVPTRDVSDGKLKNVDQKISDLLSGEPTDSNVKTALSLLDREAMRIVRELLKRRQLKAAQRVLDVMDLLYKQVSNAMQRYRYSFEFIPTNSEEKVTRGYVKNRGVRPISEAAIGQFPNLQRYFENIKGDTVAETAALQKATRLDLGGMSDQQLKELDGFWGRVFKIEDTRQLKLDLKVAGSEFTPQQKSLDAKFLEIINRFTGARLVNEGLENLRERIAELDSQIAELGRVEAEGKNGRPDIFRVTRNQDPMAFLFGMFDENQYAPDIGVDSELGFRGDRKVTDRDLLVGERGRLTRELQAAMQDGIKAKAKRLELGMESLKEELLKAAKTALGKSGSMSFQDIAQVYNKYSQYTEFLNMVEATDRLIASEKRALMEGGMSPAQAESEARAKYEGLTQSARDFEEEAANPKDTRTLDMFESEKKVEQMAAGEISANEITEADVPAVMGAMARQLAKAKGKPEFKDKLSAVSTWIAQNMRTQSLTFRQVMDAFREAGIEMPTALLNNTHLAVHTRMLDYSKANGGGYAPREFWLRSMDQALQFNPALAETGVFTDAELLMHEEWKARQEKLAGRRKRLSATANEETGYDQIFEAVEDMLFSKFGLAQMRNPRLISSDRERLALTDNINDLVDAWHRDLKLALELHPELTNALIDPEEGRILPTDWQAHQDWLERQRKIDERRAEMILKSQYHLYLPSLQGLTQDQMDALKLRIAQADVDSLDSILHTANEMAQANRFGEGTRVDPETGEIISLAEEARANLLDDLLLEDQSTKSLQEIYGTSDQRELNKIRRAMDEGTADASTREGSFGRLATESRGAEAMPDQQDLDDYEAQQQAAEDSDDLRGKTGFFSGRLTHGVVSAAVSRLTQGWKTGNQIIVLKNVSQLPDGLRERVIAKLEGRDLKGLFDEDSGITYLFSDMLDSDADVEFTLFHETYGHFGMRGFLGEKFDAFLENMYRIYPNVRREADALIEQGVPKLEAIDEALSDIAATNENIPAVKAWIGRMIAGLREIGFNQVADWMSKVTNAELAYYLKGAREYAKTGGFPMTSGAPGVVRFKAVMHDRLYEMFSMNGDKTAAYARFNPATQTWAVFKANKDDIRSGYSAQAISSYEDVLKFMRKSGKVEFRKRSGSYIEDKLPIDMPKLSEVTDIQGVKRWMRGMITKYQNEYRPVFDVVEFLRRKGVLTEEMDVKTALQLYERKIGAIIDDFRRIYVRPLYQLIDDAKKQGVDLETIEKFLLARHAAERNASVAKINPEIKDGSGMSNADAKDFLREMASKPYYNTLLEIGVITDKMSKEKLSYLRNTGMITANDFKLMSQYKHYVNLSGVREGLDKFDDVNQLVGNRFNVKGKERRAMGRSGQATDIIANTILGMEAALIRGQKNIVAQKILALLEANYDPNFAVINEIAYKRQIGEDGLVMEVEDPDYIRKKDVMVAKVNGIPTTIRFKDMDPGSFGNAIFGMVYPTPPGEIMEKLGKFNQVIGQMLTTWNPAWVAINSVRDAQTLYFNAASDGRITRAQAAQMVRMLPKAVKTAYYMAMSEAGKATNITPDPELVKMYLEMKRAGGMTSFLNRKDLESQVKEIEKILSDPKGLEKAADKFKSVLDIMEFLSLPAEIAPRLAAYTVVRQGGFTKEQAAVFSGEITVNFNMRGSTKWVRQAYLFFNPAVQGSAKLLSLFGDIGPDYKLQLKSKGFAYVAALIGLGAMANLFARAMSDDDEAGRNGLDKLPTWKRATSIVLWADGPSIPIPYGWNAFYAMGHFAMDTMLGIQPLSVTAKRVAQATFESFSPLGSAGLDSNTLSGTVVKGIAPTATLPMIEWMLNENRFGAPIRREDSLFGGAQRPDSEMAFRSVSPISRSVTQTLNELTGGNRAKSGVIDVNPALIDHLIGAYIPGLINEGYKAASVGIRVASGEDVKSASIPIVDRFRAKVPESYDSGAFRRAKELIETRYQEFKEYPELRDEILREIPGLRRAHAVVASATQEIRKLRSDLTAYENKKDIPDADKVAKLNRMREREAQVYARAVKAVMEAGPEFREAVMASN